jgi:hypothetical protein
MILESVVTMLPLWGPSMVSRNLGYDRGLKCMHACTIGTRAAAKLAFEPSNRSPRTWMTAALLLWLCFRSFHGA